MNLLIFVCVERSRGTKRMLSPVHGTYKHQPFLLIMPVDHAQCWETILRGSVMPRMLRPFLPFVMGSLFRKFVSWTALGNTVSPSGAKGLMLAAYYKRFGFSGSFSVMQSTAFSGACLGLSASPPWDLGPRTWHKCAGAHAACCAMSNDVLCLWSRILVFPASIHATVRG